MKFLIWVDVAAVTAADKKLVATIELNEDSITEAEITFELAGTVSYSCVILLSLLVRFLAFSVRLGQYS